MNSFAVSDPIFSQYLLLRHFTGYANIFNSAKSSWSYYINFG